MELPVEISLSSQVALFSHGLVGGLWCRARCYPVGPDPRMMLIHYKTLGILDRQSVLDFDQLAGLTI